MTAVFSFVCVTPELTIKSHGKEEGFVKKGKTKQIAEKIGAWFVEIYCECFCTLKWNQFSLNPIGFVGRSKKAFYYGKKGEKVIYFMH